MSPARRTARSYTRVGWLATTLALAVALVVGSWINYRGARSAVSTLNRGQADVLEAAFRARFPPWSPEVDSLALHQFVRDHPETGVRFVALLDWDGRVFARAGEPAAPLAGPPRTEGPGMPEAELVTVGDRIRTYIGRPGGRPGGRPEEREEPTSREDSASPRFDADADPRSGRRSARPSLALLEFEPLVASGLLARASQSLALAAVGATILTIAALLFWRISEQYESARTRLEEQRRLSLLGEMSAVLAHEIRNPLASLKGNAQLLGERLAEGSREKARADRIVFEAVRLETLTTDLLDFARMGPIEMREQDPVEVARTSIADAGGSEDGFVLDAGQAPERWVIDGRRLRHALANLLQNARQASPGAAPPRLRVARERDELVYEVRDFGPGLPAGSEERLFDPFFTTRTNGTGLGLAVARRVVEMHGGQITARSHPEGGAVFRIVIPRGEG